LTKTTNAEEVIPSAKRLINSLRSLGYEFPTAVAEIVDNAIEAEATEVYIQVDFDGENSRVLIANNGRGMTDDQLKEAMRFGSEREYSERSLGKFGLGLKTASFSQCKTWVVATRNDPQNQDIIAYKWDLEHINKNDRWEILPVDEKNLDPSAFDYLKNRAGTVVLWERLDRILEYKNPNSEHARKRFSAMCRDLEEHVAMVFHRFIRGEVSDNKLKIILNGNEIVPWDPFARTERATKELEAIRIPLEHEGIHGDIVIEPYILPPKNAFSTPLEHSKAGGPKKWNQQQGFYIYRNDRMIQSGGWCRLRTFDEHTKLARFAINFSSKLDNAFKIDVSKMYVLLPAQIRKEVEEKIQPLVSRAREIYDQAEKTSPEIPALTIPPSARNQTILQHRESSTSETMSGTTEVALGIHHGKDSEGSIKNLHRPVITQETIPGDQKHLWTFDEIFERLKKSAKISEIPVIERVFFRVREELKKSESGKKK